VGAENIPCSDLYKQKQQQKAEWGLALYIHACYKLKQVGLELPCKVGCRGA
jgi:hypothetical protein